MSARKRKTPTDTPRAATPVSAIAARRRLAEPSNETEGEDRRHSLTPSNAFSALQGLRRSGNPESKPDNSPLPVKKPPALRSARSVANAEGDQGIERTVVQYTSFKLDDGNHKLVADGIELHLDDGERFLVQGMYGIKVLDGVISIAGATLRPSSIVHWVHAPWVHAIPVIRTHADSRLQIVADETHHGLRHMGALSPLFSKIWNNESLEKASLPGSGKSFQMLFTSSDASNRAATKELASPPAWNKELASFVKDATSASPLRYLVCGPKSAGKSTFSKMLVNRLVTRSASPKARSDGEPSAAPVALLDIDPGQAEFGPPGTLSLILIHQPNLGVPFTHPGVPDAAYTVVAQQSLAAIKPGSNSQLYLRCIARLYRDFCHLKGSLPPLVINTPGWIQGTGLELLCEIISTYQPHEVLYMSQEGPAESVEALEAAALTMHQETGKPSRFTTLPSQPSEGMVRTAAELREMQTMSYFHMTRPRKPAVSPSLPVWDPMPLSQMKPWLIPYDKATNLRGILCYDYQPPPELLADSINGSVLAAVRLGSAAALPESMPAMRRTPDGIPYIPNPDDLTLDPQHSETMCLVLIRGIDTKRKCLLGLSPLLQAEQLAGSSDGVILLHGQFGSTNWAFTEDLHAGRAAKGEQQPYVEILSGNQSRPTGSRQWRVRRDLGRSNQ